MTPNEISDAQAIERTDFENFVPNPSVAEPTPSDYPTFAYPLHEDAELIDVGEKPFVNGPCYPPNRTGTTWYAFVRNRGEFNIQSADFGRSRNLKPASNTIFEFKKIPHLRKGQVETVFYKPFPYLIDQNNSDDELKVEYNQVFQLNNETYELSVESRSLKDGTIFDVLILRSDRSFQILDYIVHYDEIPRLGNLIWAGDLDHDGHLDLYFGNFTVNGGYFQSRLFLSKDAETEKLVGYSAEFDALCR